MALLHQCGNGHWMDSLDSELKRTLVCKTKTSTSLNRREIQLIRKTGWGTIERERHMDRKRKGWRMQCFMKKEDESLIDVENVETTGERCCHLS